MTEIKHTPGPWVVFVSDFPNDLPGIDTIDGFSIVMFGDNDTSDDAGIRGKDREQAFANAALISAAPDLLEALKYARRFLNSKDHDTAYVDAAISKASSPALQATGEQS